MALITVEKRDTDIALRRACNEVIKRLSKPREIDWEQRRYEIAKAVLPSLIPVRVEAGYPTQNRVAGAIRYADELIKQLKGGEL